MLRSAQRKTGLSIPPRPPPSNLFGEHNQFLAAWGGTACALPVNGRLTLRQGECVQLVVEPMNGRLYLAVKAYSSGRRACRCATWCFNRCQVHVEISGNRLHPVPPSHLLGSPLTSPRADHPFFCFRRSHSRWSHSIKIPLTSLKKKWDEKLSTYLYPLPQEWSWHTFSGP